MKTRCIDVHERRSHTHNISTYRLVILVLSMHDLARCAPDGAHSTPERRHDVLHQLDVVLEVDSEERLL